MNDSLSASQAPLLSEFNAPELLKLEEQLLKSSNPIHLPMT